MNEMIWLIHTKSTSLMYTKECIQPYRTIVRRTEKNNRWKPIENEEE